MKIFEDFSLKEYNSYRLDATCRKALFPESDEDIRELFSDRSVKRFVLGGGFNVILSKRHYDEEFVIFSKNYSAIELSGDTEITAASGASMKDLSEFALSHHLTGLEIYYDIPSSVGGAVVMNAGAGGEDVHALLRSVLYYDPEADSFKTRYAGDADFEYRNSFFQRNPQMIVCRAVFELAAGNPELIRGKMDATKTARWAKQPREYPNAGSVFKRPPGRFVGPMIDELGLKGYTVGGAKISEKHSGFIVNFNQATGADIIALIAHVRSEVKNVYSIDLEVEQRII